MSHAHAMPPVGEQGRRMRTVRRRSVTRAHERGCRARAHRTSIDHAVIQCLIDVRFERARNI